MHIHHRVFVISYDEAVQILQEVEPLSNLGFVVVVHQIFSLRHHEFDDLLLNLHIFSLLLLDLTDLMVDVGADISEIVQIIPDLDHIQPIADSILVN